MILYYTPGACSLCPHIVLREGGFDFELIRVDLATRQTENGDDFLAINPKGYVPALQLDDGTLLTENQVIIQYLADQKPAAPLAPPAGSMARYELMAWLAFIATELHKSFSPLYRPDLEDATRQAVLGLIGRRLGYVEGQLGDRPFLFGDHFTIADAYLFVVLTWTDYHRLDISPWPHLAAYKARMATRPAIQAALKAEGLIG